jgi:SAM-dependent methyltransferase
MKQQFAKEYGDLEQWHWWFRGRQRILASALEREIGGSRKKLIASVGCGPADGLVWLKQFIEPGGRVVGMDAEPLHARPSAQNVDYIVGKLEDAPVATASFDVVLALDVLEHLDDDTAGLREAARLVKPAGLLFVTVPALPSLWGGQDVVSHHRRRYTKKTLAQLFERAGLPAPRLTYFNTLLFPLIAAIRWSRRATGQAEHAHSDFEDTRPGLVNDLLTSVFTAEKLLVPHVTLPIGVSLLATVRISR